MIKCYKCHKKIEDNFTHCPNCGALLKPTQKLLDAVKNNNREAIKQLYKMTYNTIDYYLRTTGINESISKTLINKSFIALIKDLSQLPSLDSFSMMLEGICDHTAFNYLSEHNLEVHEKQVEYRIYEVTDDMIDTLYHEMGLIKDKKTKPKRLVILLVVALVIAAAGGYAGFNFYQKSSAKHKVEAYLDLCDKYCNTVSHYEEAIFGGTNTMLDYMAEPAAIVVRQYDKDWIIAGKTNYMPTLLQCEYDIDGDGQKEFLLGFNKDNKMVITGLYRYDFLSGTVKRLSIENKVWYRWFYKITLFKNHEILVKYNLDVDDNKYYGILYSYKNKKLEIIKKKINNPEKYILEREDEVVKLKGKTMDALSAKYYKVTGIRRYSIINRKVDAGTFDLYDLDGDGVKDRIYFTNAKQNIKQNIKQHMVSFPLSINDHNFHISINNIRGLTTNHLDILRTKNGKIYILLTVQDDDMKRSWKMYSYKNGKLQLKAESSSNSMKNKGEKYLGIYMQTVNGNTITVDEEIKSNLVGNYYTSINYKVKGDQVKKSKSPYKMYPLLGGSIFTSTPPICYVKTKKTFRLYNDISCQNKGIVLPKGKKVRVTKVTFGENSNTYEFSYKNKKGYLKTSKSIKLKKQKNGYHSNKYFETNI